MDADLDRAGQLANGAGQLAKAVIRPAEPADVDELHDFVVALAEFERLPEPVAAEPRHLAEALFGPRPFAEAVVAAIDGRPVGFALFYPTYSTVLGRPGIHLDDLYVRPEYRGAGLGRALLAHLADLAVQRGCGRLEWWAMRTNEPALRFYRRLQARTLEEIAVLRLDGDLLRQLAPSARLPAGVPPQPRHSS